MPRRLPIYLLIDTSGSMYGKPIQAVKNGVDKLVFTLRQNPYALEHPLALETFWLSVITFSSSARQVTPLTELVKFQLPPLEASGFYHTALDKALSLVAQCISREVREHTHWNKGDFAPLIFIMTNAHITNTDSFERSLTEFEQQKTKINTVFVCDTGKNSNIRILKKITEMRREWTFTFHFNLDTVDGCIFSGLHDLFCCTPQLHPDRDLGDTVNEDENRLPYLSPEYFPHNLGKF